MGKKKKNKKNLIDVGGRPPKFKTKQELINKSALTTTRPAEVNIVTFLTSKLFLIDRKYSGI